MVVPHPSPAIHALSDAHQLAISSPFVGAGSSNNNSDEEGNWREEQEHA